MANDMVDVRIMMGAGLGEWVWGEGWGSRGVGGTPGSYIYNTGVNISNTM